MTRTYELISSDAHLEIKPERWTHRVAERYRERAPRTVRTAEGGEGFIIEGRPLQQINFIDNRSGRKEWKPLGLKVDDAAGSGGPDQRVREMDEDGLDAEVLFPGNQRGYIMWRSIGEDAAYHAVVRGYNDWLAEEYCSYDPERLLGVGVIPSSTLSAAIEELEHCAELGLRVVLLGSYPSGKSFPTLDDDQFYARAIELGVSVAVHVMFFMPLNGGPLFQFPKGTPEVMSKLGRTMVDHLAHFGLAPAKSISPLVLSGVFDRLPDLKIFFAETRLGWIPFFLENMAMWYERNLGWSEEVLGFEPPLRNPVDYVRDNLYFSVQYERFSIENRHHLNVDRIMFASDFPHIECNWPNSRPILDEIYAEVPAEEKRKIWAGNAVEFFKLGAAASPN